MSGSRMSNDQEQRSPRESGEDSEDESEILEESPCGRWLKRREEVEQRDVPGIDSAYLAMDTEEGVEVVWNEVQFSERRNFKAQEEKIQLVFENLTQLEHPNIVKFHRYWTDTHNDKPRVIFITEYMSSGSLKQFLKRTKRNVKRLPLQAWKRWCTQILSALSYLHSCLPPIIHGNLSCDTIFIQHNGLVKIGSVAPDSINQHVKTCREKITNMHFIAPEYGTALSPAIDIYSFGMCALEMAALEIVGNGDSGNAVTDENIQRTIDGLEDEQQQDFIRKCLDPDYQKRPSARELLFHPLLFEVHSLKSLAAHCLVKTAANISETITDEVMQKFYGAEVIIAETVQSGEARQLKMSDFPMLEKLEKFVEDVKNGIYPLTAFGVKQPPPPRSRAISPEMAESVKSVTPEPIDVESRKIVHMMCNIKPKEDAAASAAALVGCPTNNNNIGCAAVSLAASAAGALLCAPPSTSNLQPTGSGDLLMTILLRMDDKMNRQLTCLVSRTDDPYLLAHELVHFGFINESDREKIALLIEDSLKSFTPSTSEELPTLPAPSCELEMTTISSTPTQEYSTTNS